MASRGRENKTARGTSHVGRSDKEWDAYVLDTVRGAVSTLTAEMADSTAGGGSSTASFSSKGGRADEPVISETPRSVTKRKKRAGSSSSHSWLIPAVVTAFMGLAGFVLYQLFTLNGVVSGQVETVKSLAANVEEVRKDDLPVLARKTESQIADIVANVKEVAGMQVSHAERLSKVEGLLDALKNGVETLRIGSQASENAKAAR